MPLIIALQHSPFTRQTANLQLKQSRVVENKTLAWRPVHSIGGADYNFVYTVCRF